MGRILATVVLLACLLPAQRAAAVLESLSREEKVGQLFMSWILAREEGQQEARARMRRWVEEVGLGGIIASLGTAEEGRRLAAQMQEHAGVPLLMAGDFENGVAFRFEGATSFGPNMLVGAAGVPALAQRVGRAVGAEARALGYHWAFAPVLDVNNNPANPIINVRSYGEDPERVAVLGTAFVRGLQEHVLACGKHFPGHGNVATDSHLSLPTVPSSREEIEDVELRPFRRAIAEADLGSIMTGHLAVPALGEAPDVPATLSRRILVGVLRERLGFEGLVVTDALGMGGVEGALDPGEVAVRALNAGADVLLMPPDPFAARDAVVAAVAGGRVSVERLDDAVGRILAVKERMGLLGGGAEEAAAVPAFAELIERHRPLAREVAEAGLTLARDRQAVLPLAEGTEVVLVQLQDKAEEAAGVPFGEALAARTTLVAEHTLSPESGEEEVAKAAEALAAADVAVVAMHVRVRSYSGRIGLPEAFGPVVEALGRARRPVVVSFGNPYLLRRCPGVGAYVCAYGGSEGIQRVAGRALTGAGPAFGRLPVTIPGHEPLGSGLSLLPAGGLRRDRSAASVGVDPALPGALRAVLQEEVAEGAFPGAVALVVRRGAVVAEVAAGRETYGEDAPAIEPGATFDLASLTKVCATTPAVLRLAAAGKLSLDEKVADLVPAFAGEGKDEVTVRHLLTHTSGLPAYRPLHRSLEGRDAIVEAAAEVPLSSAPGETTRYSDLGLILLMACVEGAAGADFVEVTRREVFAPLQMTGARFNPGPGALDAVPTEVVDARGGAVRGVVHDENAHAMGGVSGHAGLFATADDVARLACAFLYGGRGWLPPSLARGATRPAGDGGRALGWDRLEDDSWAGSGIPDDVFGHTGFTGTSVWCSPRRDLCVVLLTNRVYPTRDNRRISAARRRVHDTVLAHVR